MENESFYPNRARDRTFLERLRSHFALVRWATRSRIGKIGPTSFHAISRETNFVLWAAGAGIPGLIQLIEGRVGSAFGFIVCDLLLVMGVYLEIHSSLSNFYIGIILLLSAISVIEAVVFRSQRASIPNNQHRNYCLNRIFAAFTVVSTIFVCVVVFASLRFGLYSVSGVQAPPGIVPGDLLLTSPAHDSMKLPTGTIVIVHSPIFAGALRFGIVQNNPGDAAAKVSQSTTITNDPEMENGNSVDQLNRTVKNGSPPGFVYIQPVDSIGAFRYDQLAFAAPGFAPPRPISTSQVPFQAEANTLDIVVAVVSPASHRRLIPH